MRCSYCSGRLFGADRTANTGHHALCHKTATASTWQDRVAAFEAKING